MSDYIIRPLHLITAGDIAVEARTVLSTGDEEFRRRMRRFPRVLKVLAMNAKAQLPSSLAALQLDHLPGAHGSAYVFSDDEALLATADRATSTAAPLAEALRVCLTNCERRTFDLPLRDRVLQLDRRTLIMGIINCTPDSFYDGGRFDHVDRALERGLQMAAEGVDIIDIGGESTRPRGVYGAGAEPVSAEEELRRIIPVITALRRQTGTAISIDTYKAVVAEAAIAAGADLINDISGTTFDPQMATVAAKLKVPVVIMHLKGTPQNMQQSPQYENLMDEIFLWLHGQVQKAVRVGVASNRIIIDPGLGFGKRIEHNYEIIRRLTELRALGCPILVGASRKAFTGKAGDLPPAERLPGTVAATTLAAANGAHIVRVHDPREVQRALQIADRIAGKTNLASSEELK